MPRIVAVLSLALGGCLAIAQDQPKSPAVSDSDKIPANNPPLDPAKLTDAVRASFYHPDNLAGLECNVSFDWSGVMHALQVDDPAPERMKIIEGLKVRSRAARDKAPEVTLNWSGGEPPDHKEQFEGAIKQMVSGFYQMYWNLIASSPVPPGSVFEKIEQLDDGQLKTYTSSAGGSIEVTVDKEHIPTHYSVNSPAMRATIDAHYTPSPTPVPGDVRRLTELDVSNQMGASTLKVEVILDYQAVDVFYVPQHVTFNVVGAYSVGMDFSGCSATKGAAGSNAKN